MDGCHGSVRQETQAVCPGGKHSRFLCYVRYRTKIIRFLDYPPSWNGFISCCRTQTVTAMVDTHTPLQNHLLAALPAEAGIPFRWEAPEIARGKVPAAGT